MSASTLRYGGIFDLGPDGYARALRDEFDPFPPVVVTPIYATADARFEWLNRAQCIGVGRMDMTALRLEFDVYVVAWGRIVGVTTASRRSAPHRQASMPGSAGTT